MIALAAGGAVAAAIGWRSGRIGPFRLREIVPGRVYVCRQPEAGDLATAARERAIGVVLSLRDPTGSSSRFEDERREAARLGLRYEGLGFRRDAPVPRSSILGLIDLFETPGGAILVHCRQGVDRSGFAGAVARLLGGGSLEAAKGELSLWRGHFDPLGKCPFHRVLGAYEQFLASEGVRHDGTLFASWVRTRYAPAAYDARIEIAPLPERVAPGVRLVVRMKATNRGSEPWRLEPAGGSGTRFGGRLVGPLHEGAPRPPAVDLPRFGPKGEVLPGATAEGELSWTAPAEPGRYELELDLVEEHVRWFHDVGWPAAVRAIDVE
jgi:hypothetical protein